MSEILKMYEGYWGEKAKTEQFQDYERNEALRQFFKNGEKVLDLAAGEGAVSEFIALLGCDVTALDISSEALSKAAKRGVKTVKADVEKKLPFKDSEFDVVFWGDNIEHLFMPAKTLNEIKRVLKDEGRLIISCPNMGYWRYRLYYLLNGMIPQTEWYILPPWQWQHIRFFNKSVINDFLTQNGFKMKSFKGVSRRRLDKLLKALLPSLFGMIMVIEADKND